MKDQTQEKHFGLPLVEYFEILSVCLPQVIVEHHLMSLICGQRILFIQQMYILNTYCVPGTVLGIQNPLALKQRSLPS